VTPDPSVPARRTLLLCIHNHQPVGNFDSVLEEATLRSYRPFLEVLARFPGIKATLHYSGFLLRWLADNRRDVIDLLGELVRRGQVEILGGGLYEPVLALIPYRDRLGQIRALADLVAELFGKPPDGVWLAERVWEPELATALAEAGARYLPLDDYHFIRAGLSAEELDGIHVTENNGAALRVFPGSELLRYRIPFSGVDDAVRAVLEITSRDVPYPAAIYADDGEKFGIWPGTYRTAFEEGWLSRFFEEIEARRETVTTMTFGEYAAAAPVRGRVYLPTCSYIEMGEWALPPGMAVRFARILRDFRAGRHAETRPFVQGGYFRNFLRKYEESNQLQKRMLGVSDRIEEAAAAGDVTAARDLLYRAQSNDVYWHGIFGGLYLNHLREAAWANLLRAEAEADRILHEGKEAWAESVVGDLDLDGGTEILLRTSHLILFVHEHDGGAVTEISLPRRGVALGHVLTRRAEGYHENLKTSEGAREGAASIHDALLVKDPSVFRTLAVDPHQRASFREAVYGEETGERILDEASPPLAATAGRVAAARIEGDDTHLVLVQDILLSGDGAKLALQKVLDVKAGEERFLAAYHLVNTAREPFSGRFVSEWNLNFLSGDGPDRRIEGTGDAVLSAREVARGLKTFRIVDAWRRIAVAVAANREFALLRYPIETASLSEAGAEKIHQGVCLRLLFPVRLPPGESESVLLSWTIIPVSS
jgi:4-alpha-glucanotransferase